ncbi:tetratricopeptide repeat protein, partial [bacterium]|nr:tetratricopeptide repeat protein [bacterium]
MAAMVEVWTKRKRLLVVDNLHRLLNDKTEPADEDARLLLERISQTECQLLTLGWPGTDALGTSRERVLRWELEGIADDPGVQKLRAEGVEGEPKTIPLEQVVDKLDGNPKMLEILAVLIRENGGQASVLDERPDWIEDSMKPLYAMWEAIGPELQELLTAICIFRRGRTAERLERFLDRKKVQLGLEALHRWGLAKQVDGNQDWTPDHDLARKMVTKHVSEETLKELHGRAATFWGKEGTKVLGNRMPTRIEKVQPLIEMAFHLAEAGEGNTLVSLLNSSVGDEALAQVLDRLGAWGDRVELWERAVAVVSDPKNEAILRHHLAMAYGQLGDWDRALKEYEASLKIEEKFGDQQGIAASRHQIGIVYQLKGDWDRALKEYEASLRIKEKLGDQQGIAQSRHQIGMV